MADSPPAPRPGMRSLSVAWLLGGLILLAASVSCNRTYQGENLALGGLECRRKRWAGGGSRADAHTSACPYTFPVTLIGVPDDQVQLDRIPDKCPKDALETNPVWALPISVGVVRGGKETAPGSLGYTEDSAFPPSGSFFANTESLIVANY